MAINNGSCVADFVCRTVLNTGPVLVCDRIKRENSQTRKSKQRFVWQGPIEQSHLVCVYIVAQTVYEDYGIYLNGISHLLVYSLLYFDVTFFVNRKCSVSITSIQVATDQLTLLYCMRRVTPRITEGDRLYVYTQQELRCYKMGRRKTTNLFLFAIIFLYMYTRHSSSQKKKKKI